MGIRPSFYILVGIDDAKQDDSRKVDIDLDIVEDLLNFRDMTKEEMWSNGDIWDDWHQAELGIPGTSKYLYNLLYNPEGSGEYRIPNVVGYVVHQSPYDDNVIRALATINNKYMNRGWERIPTLDPLKHNLRYRSGYTQEDLNCNRFVDGVFESMPSLSRIRWKQAQHYLRMVGWEIPETDLRYLLVWDWS